MAKRKKYTKKDVANTMQALDFLKGKGMFSGMKIGLCVGDKAIVLGSPVNMKGHAPAAKFAQLSDGSKITLTGKNKGLIIK